MGNKYDDLIEKTKKLAALAVELKESSIYETCEFHVVKMPRASAPTSEPLRFGLYRIVDREMVAYGTAGDCRKWLNRRDIPNEEVYDYLIIEKA